MLAISLMLQEEDPRLCDTLWKMGEVDFKVGLTAGRTCGPHITLLAGFEESARDQIVSKIRSIAEEVKTLEFQSLGVGLLAANKPVVYVRWNNEERVRLLRNTLISRLGRSLLTGSEHIQNYDWMMKTTIFYGDLQYDSQLVPLIVRSKEIALRDSYTVKCVGLGVISYCELSGEKLICIA